MVHYCKLTMNLIMAEAVRKGYQAKTTATNIPFQLICYYTGQNTE